MQRRTGSLQNMTIIEILSERSSSILSIILNFRGETEVREAEVAKAKYYAAIGNKDIGIEKLKEMLDNTVGTGQKIDLVFVIIRLAMAFNDISLVKEYVNMAKEDVHALLHIIFLSFCRFCCLFYPLSSLSHSLFSLSNYIHRCTSPVLTHFCIAPK